MLKSNDHYEKRFGSLKVRTAARLLIAAVLAGGGAVSAADSDGDGPLELRRPQPILWEPADVEPAGGVSALSGPWGSGGEEIDPTGEVVWETYDAPGIFPLRPDGQEELPLYDAAGCRVCPGVNRHPGHPRKPRREMPGDVNRGDNPPRRYVIDQRLRSGDSEAVYQWAQPAITPKHAAGYVGGGGGFFRGRPRTTQEGTWGLDYGGFFGHAKVWLNYTCNRFQGGEGAYQTEHESLRTKLGSR